MPKQDLLARYRASTHWRGDDQCAYWLSTISSSAHGKFRVAPRPMTRAA